MLLLNCKWGFPVSRMLLTPEFIALTEEKRLHPSPGVRHGRDTDWNTLANLVDDVAPDSTSFAVANTFFMLLPTVTMVFGSFSLL